MGDALVDLKALIAEPGALYPLDYASAIADLIHVTKFGFNGEAQLQLGLEMMFGMAGLSMTREAVLTPGERIDFWGIVRTARIGIEVKIKGSTPAVLGQLERYAMSGKVDALVLVTSRSKHRSLGGRLLPGPGPTPIPVVAARLPWVR